MAIKERMEEVFGRGFDYIYIRKPTGKVRNEIVYEIDSATIEPRLAELRENYRMMRERLYQIVYSTPEDGGKPPANRDVNEAAKNIVMMDLAILQAEAAAGMYKKPVEAMAREFRYDPLPAEVRTVVTAAWTGGGLLPRAAIEQMVPARKENESAA
jgi:hypothetical protein